MEIQFVIIPLYGPADAILRKKHWPLTCVGPDGLTRAGPEKPSASHTSPVHLARTRTLTFPEH